MAEWSKGWIRLYHEIIIDDKMCIMSDHLWRRAVECMLAAGAEGRGGYLPESRALAHKLAVSEAELEADLTALAAPGVKILEKRPDGWFVSNHQKRNKATDSTGARRQEAWRKRQQERYEALRNALPNALLTPQEDKKDKNNSSAPRRNGQSAEAGNPDYQPMFDALMQLTQLDPKLKASSLGKTARELLAAGYSAAQVNALAQWWTRNDWRGRKGQAPTLAQVVDNIGKVKVTPAAESDRDDYAADPATRAIREARRAA